MESKRFHIIYDLRNCNQKINDQKAIREFIEGFVKVVNMSILQGPVVAEGIPQNPGLSSFVIIDFSHISIHTFTKYNEALIDIFSCKEFDKLKAGQYCTEFFGVSTSDSRTKEVWWG